MGFGGRRLWLILGILVAIGVWIGIGMTFRDDEPDESVETTTRQHTSVAVRISKATPVQRVLVLQGDLQPEQAVSVRAETAGQIRKWHASRGASVQPGDVLAELDPGERTAQLSQARANLKVARQQLDATRQLVAEGYEPAIQLEARQAELEAAQASLAAIEEDIAHTRITSPIPGRINQRIAEEGDFVAAGGEVAQVVNSSPLRATVHVPQHQVERVQTGQAAVVHVLRHGQAEGQVSFIASLADPATRTFRVEVEVPNPDRQLPAGTSARVEIATETVPAHKVSPAILSLDDEGRVGAKSVNDASQVAFHPIEVVRAAKDGIWITGLPEKVRIITVGQGFVSAGETVIAEDEKVLTAQGAEADQ